MAADAEAAAPEAPDMEEAAPGAAAAAEVAAADAPDAAAAEGGAQELDNDGNGQQSQRNVAIRTRERQSARGELVVEHLVSTSFALVPLLQQRQVPGGNSDRLNEVLAELQAALHGAIGIARRITEDGEEVGDEEWQVGLAAAQKKIFAKGMATLKEPTIPQIVGVPPQIDTAASVSGDENEDVANRYLLDMDHGTPRGPRLSDADTVTTGRSGQSGQSGHQPGQGGGVEETNRGQQQQQQGKKKTKTKTRKTVVAGDFTIEMDRTFEDHVEASLPKALALANRLADETEKFRGGEVGPDTHHLLMAQFDPCTPFLLELLGFSLGQRTTKDIEIAASNVVRIFQTRMNALSTWKEKDPKYSSCDLESAPLSSMMWFASGIKQSEENVTTEAEEPDDDDSREVPWKERPYPAALYKALIAMAKAMQKIRKEWHGTALLPTAVKEFLSTVACDLTVLRAMQILEFEEMAKIGLKAPIRKKGEKGATVITKAELDSFRALIEQNIPGHETLESLKASRVLEEVIVPAKNSGLPREEKIALLMSKKLAEVLGLEGCSESFAIAESVPASVIFRDCAPDELQKYRKGLKRPFLSSKQQQRMQACRKVFYGNHALSCRRALRYHGLSKDAAMTFAVGVFCLPQTYFRDAECQFLVDYNSHERSDVHQEYIEKLMGSEVQKAISKADDAFKDFQKDEVFLELTGDRNNRTSDTLDMVTAYISVFELRRQWMRALEDEDECVLST